MNWILNSKFFYLNFICNESKTRLHICGPRTIFRGIFLYFFSDKIKLNLHKAIGSYNILHAVYRETHAFAFPHPRKVVASIWANCELNFSSPEIFICGTIISGYRNFTLCKYSLLNDPKSKAIIYPQSIHIQSKVNVPFIPNVKFPLGFQG